MALRAPGDFIGWALELLVSRKLRIFTKFIKRQCTRNFLSRTRWCILCSLFLKITKSLHNAELIKRSFRQVESLFIMVNYRKRYCEKHELITKIEVILSGSLTVRRCAVYRVQSFFLNLRDRVTIENLNGHVLCVRIQPTHEYCLLRNRCVGSLQSHKRRDNGSTSGLAQSWELKFRRFSSKNNWELKKKSIRIFMVYLRSPWNRLTAWSASLQTVSISLRMLSRRPVPCRLVASLHGTACTTALQRTPA